MKNLRDSSSDWEVTQCRQYDHSTCQYGSNLNDLGLEHKRGICMTPDKGGPWTYSFVVFGCLLIVFFHETWANYFL